MIIIAINYQLITNNIIDNFSFLIGIIKNSIQNHYVIYKIISLRFKRY